MSDMIFANLPVADLDASKAFYTAIGFVNNPTFTDATAACMVLNDHFAVMLITHARWAEFTQRPRPPAGASEVMLAVPRKDRATVDALVELAAKEGGTADVNPVQDAGFMYSRSMTDLDGHIWEWFWMDMSAFAGDAKEG